MCHHVPLRLFLFQNWHKPLKQLCMFRCAFAIPQYPCINKRRSRPLINPRSGFNLCYTQHAGRHNSNCAGSTGQKATVSNCCFCNANSQIVCNTAKLPNATPTKNCLQRAFRRMHPPKTSSTGFYGFHGLQHFFCFGFPSLWPGGIQCACY